MRLLHRILTFFLLLPMAAAATEDAELYDPAPPANSAFVRVVHGLADTAKLNATIGKVSLGTTTYPSISDYQIVPAGKHAFSAGKISADFTIAAGKYYSILLVAKKKPAVAEDTLISNPAKTRLYFYNLSDSTQASVFAPTQKISILDKVKPGDAPSREMNALTLALQVKAGDVPAQTFSDVPLKRRIGTSLLLAGKKGAYKAVLVANAVKR